MTIRILTGDCREKMAAMEEHSIDSVVCDPPYGLKFMGVGWDSFKTPKGTTGHDRTIRFDKAGGNHNPVDSADAARTRRVENGRMQQWHESWAREAYRVLKPGGYMLAMGGDRTVHRLASAIEDSGFEIRGQIAWIHGAGFPKAWNFATQYKGEWCDCDYADKRRNGGRCGRCGKLSHVYKGFSSALKPAMELIIVARKPLIGTLAANVCQYGTGALNIDGCRIETDEETGRKNNVGPYENKRTWNPGVSVPQDSRGRGLGRWPPNVILDETAAAALDAMSGERKSGGRSREPGESNATTQSGVFSNSGPRRVTPYNREDDTGGASRFMKVVKPDALPIESGDELRFKYTAKASRSERNKGLEGMPEREGGTLDGGHIVSEGRTAPKTGRRPTTNHHPTVKPLDLMQWLVKLVTPPGGTVLDCFGGSGSTMIAADREGFHGIYIEADPEYVEIARRRIMGDAPLFADVAAD